MRASLIQKAQIITLCSLAASPICLSFSVTHPKRNHFGILSPRKITHPFYLPVSPVPPQSSQKQICHYIPISTPLQATKQPNTPPNNSLQKLPESDKPVAFVDIEQNSFIDCYVDSVATLDGVEYTIGAPCDYSVALCYFEDDDQLVPIELDDAMMDDIFPVAEMIVEDEFGEELVLQRTPQTLTLVGELEEGGDEEEVDEGEDWDDDNDDDLDEEVEILLSFEHDGGEFHLVRLLDPVLLVGKQHPDGDDKRVLLTPEESDLVMPELEEIFLAYQEDEV